MVFEDWFKDVEKPVCADEAANPLGIGTKISVMNLSYSDMNRPDQYADGCGSLMRNGSGSGVQDGDEDFQFSDVSDMQGALNCMIVLEELEDDIKSSACLCDGGVSTFSDGLFDDADRMFNDGREIDVFKSCRTFIVRDRGSLLGEAAFGF